MKSMMVVFLLIFSNCLYATEGIDTLVFCGKVNSSAFHDIFTKYHEKDDDPDTYLAFGIDEDTIDYRPREPRLTSEGHIYLLNKDMLKFGLLSVSTMQDSKETDITAYMNKGNSVVGGIFYSKVSDKENIYMDTVYINPIGDVFHLELLDDNSNDCINKFPQDIRSLLKK